VFDASFGSAAPNLLHAYRVPAVFDQDYLSVLGALCFRVDYLRGKE
jgi:hypothetical protein